MSYIFLLISLGLLFINLYLGCAISIVALIISIINFKKKDFLNTVTLILSSIVIIICIISFITSMTSSFKKNVEIIEDAKDESKKNSYISYEQKLEGLAKEYVIEDQMINGMMYTGISYIQIDKLDKDNYNDCDGYVMYNYDINTYEAYIKCPDYQTDGYDASNDK